MSRFLSAAAALLMAVVLASPVAAVNQNLTATARYSASSEWESDRGNMTFVAARAFDGDAATRWNVAGGDGGGSWIAASWDSPVTVNRVVVREAFDRLDGFRVQRLDARRRWVDSFVAEGKPYAAVKGGDPDNPAFSIRLAPPIQTAALRILFTQVRASPSIFEVEAWNNPTGTFSGRVTDPEGQPVAGAAVSSGGDATTTDAQGRYTLVTDAGPRDVMAAKSGAFRPRTARALALPANGAAAHDFVLRPIPANLSLAATAVSSSDWENGTEYDASKANDGLLTTRWNSHDGDTIDSWLEMQWEQPQSFNEVTIHEAFNRIRNYSLERYDEASDRYFPFLNFDVPGGEGDPVVRHVLPVPVTSRRLRLMINLADAVPSVHELEVASTPVGTIQGLVREAISGAQVRRAAITDDAGVILGAANDRGEFTLRVEPGEYVLNARAEGYFSALAAGVTVDAGETQRVELAAAPRGENIAGAAGARASSEEPEHPAAACGDGDPGSFWRAKDPANQWVALRWPRPAHFTVVQLRGFQGVIQRSVLQILDGEGKSWIDLPDTSFAPEFLGSRPADFFFPEGVTTTGLRYFITATNSAGVSPGLAEILVFDSPFARAAP